METYQKIIDLHTELEKVDYEKIKNAKQLIAPETERDFKGKHPEIPLHHDHADMGGRVLKEVLELRHSTRTYSGRKITVNEFGNILYYSDGIKSHRSNAYNKDKYPVLFSPSAGGLMPINIYVAISEMEDVDSGFYYYSPSREALVQLFKGRPELELSKIYVSGFPQFAPVNIIMTGDVRRFYWKYDNRGYRLLNVDCGIMAENMCLLAEEQRIGSCMIAAFDNTAVGKVLRLDSEELPLLCLSLGGEL
ncbi:MAG: SagB/ThcOx family dehydrogenase [Varibaculum sp.]|nr:SagB/ThcOx family dehydrogenase [Varibaculum sp.]